jgi:hypothetical protein
VGNIIKVFPKPEETVLLRIKEIHKETIVGEFYRSPGFYLRASFNDLHPVEFSEEWLKKASFKRTGEVWMLEDSEITCTVNSEVTQVIIERDKRLIKIEGVEVRFLQQLQNLYSCVTGQDLNIAYIGEKNN